MTFARVRALIFVAVLFITAGVVVTMAIGRDSQTRPQSSSSCPAGMIPARITMPDTTEITLNVYNGTKRVGLAQDIGKEFSTRGFKVEKMDTAKDNKVYEEIAVIRYGPLAIGAAWHVSAYFLVDSAKMEFDIEREDDQVDVIIGTDFRQLATTTEVNQSIAAIAANGSLSLPAGTCELVG